MVMRGLISGLAPRAQSELGFIEKTAMMMQRMDASRSAELSRLAEEVKRTRPMVHQLCRTDPTSLLLWALLELTSQVKRLQQEHAQQAARIRALGCQQKMAELQKESVELAKGLSELETDANWASGELGKLRGELAGLEARDVAQELPVGPEVYAHSHSTHNLTRRLFLYVFALQNSGPTLQTGWIPVHIGRGSSRP
jgi:hypothetical protein